jgi:hypothetical protein
MSKLNGIHGKCCVPGETGLGGVLMVGIKTLVKLMFFL